MAPVDDQLAALATMSSTQLRLEWRRLTGAIVPNISPALLRLALAYEIQAMAFGGLSRLAQQKLDRCCQSNANLSPNSALGRLEGRA